MNMGDLSFLVGLPPNPSTNRLSGFTNSIIANVVEVSDRLILGVIEARTAEAFKTQRQAVFGDYVRTLRALAHLARVSGPGAELDIATLDALTELGSQLEKNSIERFGPAVTKQAVFTTWTLAKTVRTVAKMGAKPVASVDKQRDQELLTAFSECLWHTVFHLDCLAVAIRRDRPIYPDVLPEVVEGLRAAVNAYALARQGLELRREGLLPFEMRVEPIEWDEEEQILLDSSMAEAALED
jgi:hypothetical protein